LENIIFIFFPFINQLNKIVNNMKKNTLIEINGNELIFALNFFRVFS
jgi:tRNA A58 N-methylase Trm61